MYAGGLEFEWDEQKDLINQEKHGYSFEVAKEAFEDKKRIIRYDARHSRIEIRGYCVGKVNGETLTVRYTIRAGKVRVIGAGKWSKGEKMYEQKNQS